MSPASLEIDIEYAAARRNLGSPFVAAPVVASRQVPRIAAVYIPTLADRPPPATDLRRVLVHADSVYLIFSGAAAGWTTGVLPEGVDVWIDLPVVFDRVAYDRRAVNQNPSVTVRPEYDIPLKRSAALAHARWNGLPTIAWLDDDISLTDGDFMAARLQLATSSDMVSFLVLDFPDVSTVDHVERILLRRPSEVSIGGNCLFANVSACRSDFPRVYNDDWLFLFAHLGCSSVVCAGSAHQRPYRPWESLARTRHEQFGDIVIEGLKRRIADGRALAEDDPRFWQDQLRGYRARLSRLLDLAPDETLRNCLEVAQDEASRIEPEQVQTFVSNWSTGLSEEHIE